MVGQLRFHEALMNLDDYQDQKTIKLLTKLCKKYRILKEKTGRLTVDEVFVLMKELKTMPIELHWHLSGMITKIVASDYPLEQRFIFEKSDFDKWSS
jgi:hypothetical protein